MNQQTSDQGWQQLHEIIDAFCDHVFRKESETALISVSRREAKIEQSGTKPISANLRKSEKKSSGELSGFPLHRADVKPRCSMSS
jgi:hypothetical protein